MAGKLPMGQKELLRSKVLSSVTERHIMLMEASIRLKVSYRQAKRLLARFRTQREAGLVHRL